jgi:hypothetical protein
MNPWFKTWRSWLHHPAHGGLSRDAIYVGGMVLASECVHARRDYADDAPAKVEFTGHRTPLAGPYSPRESACARNANGKATTLSSLAAAGRCSETAFEAAFAELLEEGIAYRSVDGGYGLLRYWAMQESSSAPRMRRHRARHSDVVGDAAERHGDASRDGLKRHEKRHTQLHRETEGRHGDASRDGVGDALERHSDVCTAERHGDASRDGLKRHEKRHTTHKKLREREEERDLALAAAPPQSAQAGLSAEEIRDLLPPPPKPTLTPNAHAHVGNSNGVGIGEERESERGREYEAYLWLHAILHDTVTQPAPRAAGRWLDAYRYISAQPVAERPRVEACLRSELTSRRLPPRACTPCHVADYWHAYAAGEPPGGGNGRLRQVTARVGTAEEFARGAENNPDWVTEETGA